MAEREFLSAGTRSALWVFRASARAFAAMFDDAAANAECARRRGLEEEEPSEAPKRGVVGVGPTRSGGD